MTGVRTKLPTGAPLTLTPREAETAKLLARGLSNAEIAEQMGTTEHSIKQKLIGIYEKAGCEGRVRLARWVWERERDGSL